MIKKEKRKLTDEEFINNILEYCVLCTLTDFSKNDPKEEFRKLGQIITLYMLTKGWKVKK
jgi:hypothetical protein